ncbi:hypothetical protein ACI2K4_24295 [Micromonospora sp. NPDC050397]|uniref:hypothetical protein n=1 Tax=Micromonospora sp. NPDC050397 TaxID=3364279 RepID=UPI00384BB57D
MKFKVFARSEKSLTVMFEPTAEEIVIPPGGHIVVEFIGGGMGEVCPEPEYLMIGSPMGGDMRAWHSDGTEIAIW